jgi:hypothetical protein
MFRGCGTIMDRLSKGEIRVMNIDIPQPLKRTEFRFLFVPTRAKAPVEKQVMTGDTHICHIEDIGARALATPR